MSASRASRLNDQLAMAMHTDLALHRALLREDYVRLRRWFAERDWELWEKQIEEDSDAGKLDFLIEEARKEKAKGRLKEL